MRIGIDLGGTKIEILALDRDGGELLRERIPTPLGSYDGIVAAISGLVIRAETTLKERGTVGLAIPGTISAKTGLVKNANSTVLNGHPLDRDVAEALGRPVRVANDANCFALSEATDGAAAEYDVVFGIIAGTGIGGGISIGRQLLTGAHAIAGEWGHNPLPWPTPEESRGPLCYCGKRGCIESWCSGPALSAQFQAMTGNDLRPTEIAAAALAGDNNATRATERFLDRFARAIATVVNILDPDVIVLGGGLSNIEALYAELPRCVERYAFHPEGTPQIVRNMHGDSSGVRGAAWLWDTPEAQTAFRS